MAGTQVSWIAPVEPSEVIRGINVRTRTFARLKSLYTCSISVWTSQLQYKPGRLISLLPRRGSSLVSRSPNVEMTSTRVSPSSGGVCLLLHVDSTL